MRRLFFVTVLITLFAVSAFARPTLGVLPFTGGAAGEGDAIAGLFLGQRELRDVFNVVPRNMALNAIFTEQRFQLSDLTDPNTITSINRLLNADYVLSGSITEVGDRRLLIASIIHVETFEQVAGYTFTYGDLGEVFGVMSSMSANLVGAASRQRPAGRQNLAVLPFAHRAGVSAQDAEALAQILAIEIMNTGRHAVVPRLSIIQAALREQGFQMTDYTDNAGMASLGRAMNANLVLGGSITSLGVTNLFMTQILNVEDGRVIEADSVQYRTIEDGADLMGELAIGMIFPPGAQRDEQLSWLWMRQGRSIPVPGDTITAQLAWVNANAVSNANYLIQVRSDETIEPQTLALPAGRSNITFTFRGIGPMRILSLSTNGSLFTVNSGVTLTLAENITLRGRDNNSFLVTVSSGGTLVMNQGTEITGNRGGGVRIDQGGMFIMHDGVISNNRGTTGVYGNSRGGHGGVVNAGTFIMHGGTIFNNEGGNGGRVHRGSGAIGVGGTGGVRNYGTFSMKGGAISNNRGGDGNWRNRYYTTQDAGAGGLRNQGTFTMKGGTIIGNRGGGIGNVNVFNNGTSNIHSGRISGNTVNVGNGVFRVDITGGVYMNGPSNVQRGAFNDAGVFTPR